MSCLSAEKYEPCRNPGAASTSVQSSEKAFYQAGETLSFSCHSGYELQGDATIYCIPGHPSQWNSTPPACRGKPCPHTALRTFQAITTLETFGNTQTFITMWYWFARCRWMQTVNEDFVLILHWSVLYALCFCSILNTICEWAQAGRWVMFWNTAASVHRYFFFLCIFTNTITVFFVCVFFFSLVVIQNMDYGMEGTNIALAVFIPTTIILVVVLGIYVYFAK